MKLNVGENDNHLLNGFLSSELSVELSANENERKSSECGSHFNNFGKYRTLANFMQTFGTLTKRKFDVKSSGRYIARVFLVIISINEKENTLCKFQNRFITQKKMTENDSVV